MQNLCNRGARSELVSLLVKDFKNGFPDILEYLSKNIHVIFSILSFLFIFNKSTN